MNTAKMALSGSHGGDLVYVDFFCKTQENKTGREVQYCKEFYIRQKAECAFTGYSILFFICAAVLFISLMEKSLRWNHGGWKLIGICLGIPALICMIIYLILNF